MAQLLHEDTYARSTLDPLLDVAVHAAVAAGELASGYFRTIDARRKDDGTLVTAADEAADLLIAQQIHASYPQHAILSEEQATVYDPADEYTWIVDPIDGTTNFARGMVIWGVSIALLHQGTPIVGVLHMPLLGATYAATAGHGAFRNGNPIRTASTTAPDDQHLLMQCTRTARRIKLTTPLKSRMLGSAAYHLVMVAEGSALAGIEMTPKLWDFAAGALIITEAGGLLTTLDGGALFPLPEARADYGAKSIPLLSAANQALHEHLAGAMV